MELTFVKEEIPKITRAGGSGREAEPWESHLAQLKDTPGESYRVWTYDKRTSAVSRMSAVRDRLTKAVPEENWTLAVRPIPDTETFGVYVAYIGTYTPEEVQANAQAHAERSERVRAARAKASENGSTDAEASADGSTAEPTAKEKVAAARAARK